jgi:hypothetical protein
MKAPYLRKSVIAAGLRTCFILSGVALCLGCDPASQGHQAAAKRAIPEAVVKKASKSPAAEEIKEAKAESRESENGKDEPKPKSEATAKPDETAKGKPGEAKRVKAGKNVWLEVQGKQRRVIVEAAVCLREGMLEHLMTRGGIKAHEAILNAEVDARDIHKALILAGAKPGSTVKYTEDGKIILPTGPRIKITLIYKDKDNNKTITVPAKEWVRDNQTKKNLTHDWVFAGSQLFQNPLEPDKPPLYGANGGDVICVSNFQEALLDLPINSSKNNAELEFEAFTERIPPLGTPVTVILEPLPDAKKGK